MKRLALMCAIAFTVAQQLDVSSKTGSCTAWDATPACCAVPGGVNGGDVPYVRVCGGSGAPASTLSLT